MLRITTDRDTEAGFTVRLCGQFTGEYVAELEDTIAREGRPAERVRLDLAEVSLVDRAAMVFLCSARGKNITVENLPSYVRRWIEQERHCGPTARQTVDPCASDS